MFQSTTHCKYWIFRDESQIQAKRQEANQSFKAELIRRQALNEADNYFLTVEEEKLLVAYFLTVLKDFCRKFNPPMPRTVTSTSIQYMKRFYLNNSVIEHHPKNIMVTCVYLAAKIEEFNVTMEQFVSNIRGDRKRASNIVLQNELLLLHSLKYQLTIWHPFRSVEGFLIDIKARYPACHDPDKYRPIIDEYIDKTFSTDIFFLLPPNKLALLAILSAGETYGDDLNDYLYILLNGKEDEIKNIRLWAETIEAMFAKIEIPNKETIKKIEDKLSKCQVVVKTDSDEHNSFDEDEDEDMIPFQSYSQHKIKQEELEVKFMERKRK